MTEINNVHTSFSIHELFYDKFRKIDCENMRDIVRYMILHHYCIRFKNNRKNCTFESVVRKADEHSILVGSCLRSAPARLESSPVMPCQCVVESLCVCQ